jgi:hypothetical protein
MDVMRYLSIPPPRKTVDDHRWMVESLVPAMIAAVKAAGIEQKDHQGLYIVALSSCRIFRVQSNFSVLEPIDEFTADGSGIDVAMGAMRKAGTPQDRVMSGLKAASLNNAGVREPFTYHVLRKGGRPIDAEPQNNAPKYTFKITGVDPPEDPWTPPFAPHQNGERLFTNKSHLLRAIAEWSDYDLVRCEYIRAAADQWYWKTLWRLRETR